MDNQEINNGRRRFLTLATCGAGGVAALGVATPFVASFSLRKSQGRRCCRRGGCQ
ncbi:PetA [Neisseria gonorrhoeae]|uniref:PetA n=1 Tax=Neisseria gonorrhoeae TaxID=485 RepID=A0A378W2J2_NEIGO|nr:PetA [Neisseria gonorrhoeae]